jgi:hypothetical protein
MEISDSMATQMDQMENEVSMTQTDKELVEFYLEDDSSFIEVTAETKKSLDTIEKEGLCKSSAASFQLELEEFSVESDTAKKVTKSESEDQKKIAKCDGRFESAESFKTLFAGCTVNISNFNFIKK